MKDEIPKAVRLFMGTLTVGNKIYVIVRFPTNLNDAFYDKKQKRMIQYKEIVTPEEIRKAKRWLKKYGFEYDPAKRCYFKEIH